MPPTLTVPAVEPAGPTPPERIDQSAEVPIEVSVAAVPRHQNNGKGCVVVTINRPVDWFQLPPRLARQVAEMIRKASYEAER